MWQSGCTFHTGVSGSWESQHAAVEMEWEGVEIVKGGWVGRGGRGWEGRRGWEGGRGRERGGECLVEDGVTSHSMFTTGNQ